MVSDFTHVGDEGVLNLSGMQKLKELNLHFNIEEFNLQGTNNIESFVLFNHSNEVNFEDLPELRYLDLYSYSGSEFINFAYNTLLIQLNLFNYQAI